MDYIFIVTFFVALLSSILSGTAGGGGGFIMTPYWLLAGLSPSQGSASGSFMATGMALSSVAAFRKTAHYPKDRKVLYALVITTLIASIIGALVVPRIDVQSFKYMLAIITIAALPLLFIKPTFAKKLHRYRNGGLLLAMLILAVGSVIVSSAFSILLALTLMVFMDMSVLQMTALRRIVGIVQSLVLFVTFTVQGYFIWQHAAAGFIGGSIGSYIGTKYAIKKGERFAKYALAIMSFIGAVALLLS